MYKFLFIDVTNDPNGPGTPFIIEAVNIKVARDEASAQTVPGRKFKVYQFSTPGAIGVSRFIGLYTSGEPISNIRRSILDDPNSKPKSSRRPRGRT